MEGYDMSPSILQNSSNHLNSVPIVSSTITTILNAPPSCLEFSPLAPGIFVVGTYELDTTTAETDIEHGSGNPRAQSRSGSLMLWRLHEDRLHLLRTVSTCSAVLDLHFSPHVKYIFAIATSTGAIEVYRLDLGETAQMELLRKLQAFDPTVLILSLAWHSSATLVKPTTIAVSLSDGRLAIVDYTQDQESIQGVKAHTLEAWTVSWSWRENDLWSGGDDSKLSLSSMKTTAKECESFEKPMPTQTIKLDGPELVSDVAEESSDDKSDHSIAKTSVTMNIIQSDTKLHSAGVTSILPIQLANSESTEILFTGSYDEYVRVIEPIQGKRWRILGELHLGGGVWRLKLMPANRKCDASVWRWRVLASCMHAGSRVIDVICHHGSQRYEDRQWSFNVLAKFEEHESMNYASDCSTLGADEKGVIIASTSFYDKRLCIWNISDIQDP